MGNATSNVLFKKMEQKGDRSFVFSPNCSESCRIFPSQTITLIKRNMKLIMENMADCNRVLIRKKVRNSTNVPGRHDP